MIGKNRIQMGKVLRWILLPLLIVTAHAVEITTVLSESTTSVGRPIQFQIQIQGTSSADVPDNFAVDGLDIRFENRGINMQFDNFKLSKAVIYTFSVIPERAGNFSIPSLSVTVDGKVYKTEAQKFKVVTGALPAPSRGQSQSQQPPPIAQLLQQQMQQFQQQMQQQMQQVPGLPQSQTQRPSVPQSQVPPTQIPALDKLAYAELIIPDRKAFVGQTIPVEIRFYFDSRFRVEIVSQLGFGGEGFTAEKLSEPAEKNQVIDGVPFNVYTFKTAITPIKAGSLNIPPAQLKCVVTLPSNNPPPDDFFGGLFGQMGGMGEQREINVLSNSVDLEVKNLPKEGKPAGFSGAIGRFTLDAEASPKRAASGEPITLKLTLEGQGNFNAITEPALQNKEGWRIYPGITDFTPSDATGFGGRKTFESMLMALEAKTATPAAEFSYFDPTAEKYVTLNTAPIAIEAQAGKSPANSAPTPSASGVPADSVTPEPVASASPEHSDGASVLPTYRTASFQSVFHRKEFWIANLAAGVAFLALMAYLISVRVASGASARAAQVRRQRKKLLVEMEARGLDALAFASKGTESLEARFGSVLPEELRVAGLSDDEIQVLEPMITLHAESKYGLGRSIAELSPERRSEILTLLKQWEAKV